MGWDRLSGRGHFGLQSHGLLFPDTLQFQLDLLILGQEIFKRLVNTVVLLGDTVDNFPKLVPHLRLFWETSLGKYTKMYKLQHQLCINGNTWAFLQKHLIENDSDLVNFIDNKK